MIADSRRSRMRHGLAAGALLLALPVAASAARVVVKQSLAPTAAAPAGASGKVQLVQGGSSKAKFMVRARGLEARHGYDVVVDDAVVGGFGTNPHGAGHAIFLARKGGGKAKAILRLDFDPRGASVAVRDRETGEDVLTGEVPGDGGSTSGAFACCQGHENDEGEGECEEKTPDACIAAGGTPNAATSCLPNPCVAPVATVCCVPEGSTTGAFVGGDDDDDDAANKQACLEGATDDECRAQGGRVVSAPSCDPNPCGVHEGGDDGHDDGDGECHDGSGDDHAGRGDHGDRHGSGHGHGEDD